VTRSPSLTDTPDAELAERAAAGDSRSFGELYRRHAQAAWRVGYAVTNDREDAADAVSDAFTRVLAALPEGRLREGGSFRGYLLTATRRAGIDALRRRGRTASGEGAETALAALPSGSTPTERMIDATDSALVAAAFRTLPERWRSVLWLTEVEQVPVKEAAPMLGLSANGAAQLAVRARNGLLERYLQAHLRGDVAPECRFTVERLGAYVAGALSPRDLAKCDQHLAGCQACRDREKELEELGEGLRRAIIPLPLGLGALALKRWRFHGGLSATGRLARRAGAIGAKAERPLAVASAALFAAGLAGVTMVGHGNGSRAPQIAGGAHSDGASPAILNDQHAAAIGATLPVPAENLSAERQAALAESTTAADGSTGGDAVPIDVMIPPSPIPTPPKPPQPPVGPSPAPTPAAQLQVTVSGGGTTAAVAAGAGDGSCTGGSINGQSQGCAPAPTSSGSVLTLTSGGSSLPSQTVGLP